MKRPDPATRRELEALTVVALSLNPVAAAVLPLRQHAIDSAEAGAREMIERVRRELEAAGWDRRIVAPRPHASMGKAEYRAAAKRCHFVRLVTCSTMHARRPTEPDLCMMHPTGVDRFVEEMQIAAAGAYDAFVAKLCAKVGPVVDARLSTASSVWSYSTLTVTKADGSVERWQTQQIVNVSCLGKLFNQWPTRKLKG